MTPRAEAWVRQAQSDPAVARLTGAEGFHAQTRYPQDEETPVDRFEAHDSDQALSLATSVLSFVLELLQQGGAASPSA